MMHGAELHPVIHKSLRQIAAGNNTPRNFGEYVSNLNQDIRQPHRFSDANQWVNAKLPCLLISKKLHHLRI